MRKAKALKSEKARAVEEEERKKRVEEAKVKAAEADLAIFSAQSEEEKKKKQELAEKAKREEEEEVRRLEASRRAKVPSEGKRWMVVSGKPKRKATVIVLTKQPFNGMNLTIRQRWDKLINDTNKLVATAEETARTQLFRVNRMAVNVAVSNYERRIDMVDGRHDIEDEEILQVLSPQLEAMFGEEFVMCWVEGDSTVTLVARSVPMGPELDNGEKLGKAMKEENPEIKLGFREPVRLVG